MKIIYSILFVFILSAATSLMPAATIFSAGNLAGTVSTAGVVTGGGVWSATTTWAGGVVPVAGDSVVIVSGDLVNVSASASALSITVKSGGSVSQGAGVTNSATGTGTFTLESGSWWYASYGSATKMPQGFGTYNIDPASNWVFTTAASSSLINALPSAGPVIYGNVIVYKTGSVFAAAATITDINIQGNLIVNVSGSTLKSSNNKSSASTTIHVGGNVQIIAGALSGVDAPLSVQSCTVNIDGNVTVGDPSTAPGVAALAPVSGADGGGQRTSTFNIKGNLSYINGAKFEAGTNATSTNVLETSIINLMGNLSIDATCVTANNTPGTFALNLTGTSQQTISVGIPLAFTPATLFSLSINNTAGVSANSPLTLSGIINLISGKLITSTANLVTLTPGSSITGGSSVNYVNGPLAFQYATLGGSFTKTYPIGKGGIYRPLTLSLTQSAATTSTYTAEMFNATPSANTLPGTLSKVSSARYYVISEDAGGSAFTAGSVLLSYDTDDGVFDAAHLRIAQGPDAGGGTWVDLGGVGSAATTGTITSNSFTDLTNSAFALANSTGGTNALPVVLSSFNVSNMGRTIQLNWATSTEKNCSKFEIERSIIDEKNTSIVWNSVGSINAAGTTTSARNYSYSEKNLQAGNYQYRLKMVDYDGSYEYSKVLEVKIAFPKNFELSQNYPNPFNPSTKINYNLPSDSKVSIEVYNIAGVKICQLVNEEQSKGYYSVAFNSTSISKTISSGIYFYRLTAVDKNSSSSFSSIKKMVLLK